ncbi:MAG: AI-2E family transporter [Acidimicrobiia bacterium]|nr:AI-2E family transporter [Acidimicrobiia bacterium]
MDREAAYGSMQRLGVVAWSALGAIGLMWVAILVGSKVAIIFPPLVLGIAIIYLVNPFVSYLERRRVPRLVGSVLAYVGLVALFSAAAFFIVPVLVSQGQDLGDRFPQLIEDGQEEISRIADRFGLSVDVSLPTGQEVSDWFSDPDNQDLIRSQLGTVADVTLTVFQTVLVALVAPVVAFYLLLDLPSVTERIRNLLPEYWRDEAIHVFVQMSTAVGGFVRGQLVVAFIVGIMTSIGFWIIDLPFWLLIGMISGFFNIIPFVGPWVAGGLGSLAGLTSGDPSKALWAALVALIVQQIDNNLVSPVVLRATVRLHPATVLLALFAGGAVGGLFGVLMAVPTVAVIKIITGHLWRTRVLGQSWDEARDALIDDEPTRETVFTRLLDSDEGEGPPPVDLEDEV